MINIIMFKTTKMFSSTFKRGSKRNYKVIIYYNKSWFNIILFFITCVKK